MIRTILLLLVTLLFAAGCGSKEAKEDLWLSKLSPEDQKTAKAQATCPVTDLSLGEKGTPTKVTVKGQVVWVCCGSCTDVVTGEPDKYLAKIKK